jgi:hypothetical protein
MSLIVSFADGFTSASAPTIAGSSPEEYSILNNQSSFANITGLLFDSAVHTTIFMDYEIELSDATPSLYRQSGSLIASYDGSAWLLEAGSYVGDSVLTTSAPIAGEIQLQMSGGQVQYKSGNMAGGSFSGTLKLSITRVAA